MTQASAVGVNQPRGVDSDRVDGGRRPWRPLAAFLVLGIAVGGSLGYAYGSSKVTSYQAKASLAVQPDSFVNTPQGQNTPSVDATSYIQGQLVVLNGSQLANQVQTTLKMTSGPSVSSTQLGQSYVVQIIATAPTRQQAVAVASATGSLYARQRVAQLTASIDAQLASVAAQSKATTASLAAARAAAVTAAASPLAPSTPTENALESQLQQLLSQRNTLATAQTQVNHVVTVLSPAAPAAGALSSKTKDLVGGVLVGALLGLGLLVLLRRAMPRIRTVGDIASLDVPVLLPVLPRRPRRSARGRRAWRSSAGRLLAARLTSHGAIPSAPVVVVGATPGVGTSFVAASLASGLSERGPVLLVLASEIVNGSRYRQLRTLPSRSPRETPTLNLNASDPLNRAVPSIVPGVWLLPWGSDYPELKEAAPSVRAALLKDVLQRATAAEWLVVVDAPALSDSDLAIDCASAYGTATLVVGRGKSRPAEVLSATDLFDAHGSRFEGVILNDVPRRWLPRRGRPQSEPSFPSESSAVSSGVDVTTPSTSRAQSTPRSGSVASAVGSEAYSTEAFGGADPYATSPLRLDLPGLEGPRTDFEQRGGGGRRRAPSAGLRHGARGSR